MKRDYIELLSPAGDFDCLKAAVQAGANSVYLGGSLFNARASASNFDLPNLEKAVDYAKTRDVAIHLTLNTLLKEEELLPAVQLAEKAYEFGVDAIIVQDLGLAQILRRELPDLPLHASTQMTIHNLEDVLMAEKLGFQRAVLARELSLEEISYICRHANIEIETFIHGALCISYSGRCLFSSIVGGRSGNRGKCAGPCRLPYELLDEDKKTIEKGYLLSPKDFCGLEDIPSLIQAGVTSFKIEGRMKTPEYVATVTKIYRKYIDEFLEKNEISIQKEDRTNLMQVFNRGGFSSGHLKNKPNTEMIFKDKPNHIGIFAGTISKYISSKGHIFLTTQIPLSVGDTIMLGKENGKYTISELMINGKNQEIASNNYVEIGRMKGNIHIGDKVYKLADKLLTEESLRFLQAENKKIELEAKIMLEENKPITLEIVPIKQEHTYYQGLKVIGHSSIMPQKANKLPITKEQMIKQLSKTGDTPFIFKKINIDMEEDLFVPVSVLNDLRRETLNLFVQNMLTKYKKQGKKISYTFPKMELMIPNPKIALLLQNLEENGKYEILEQVDYIYLPFYYFLKENYFEAIRKLSEKAQLYIYLPSIIRKNYHQLLDLKLKNILSTFQITGIVLQNLGDIFLLRAMKIPLENYEIVANDTLNVFQNETLNELRKIGFNRITASTEINKEDLFRLNPSHLEVIVYGRTPLMTTQYCFMEKTNCCSSCSSRFCRNKQYFLKDRLSYIFPIKPDTIETVTTIYNSKITSISTKELKANTFRISLLEETIEETNKIIQKIKKGDKLEGKNYTNGNFTKEI